MKFGTIDTEQQVFVIAEIGNNHEGSRECAAEMIGLAAEAGANAVKFQTIVPEKLVSRDQTERLAQLNRLCLKPEDFVWLAREAQKAGVIFLSTPFDLESVDFLNPLVPAFKIASGDNQFFPLLEKVAQTGKPLIVSTGLLNALQCQNLVDRIEDYWHIADRQGQLALLHCVVAYPAPPESINLLALEVLKQIPGITPGYSDHSLGILACVAAVASGARIIEKHFTLNKAHSDFRDHQLSADPADLREMIALIRNVETLLGRPEKVLTAAEAGNLNAVRRSWAAARSLKVGERIQANSLIGVRPGTGIPATEIQPWLGKRLKHNLAAGQLLSLADVEV